MHAISRSPVQRRQRRTTIFYMEGGPEEDPSTRKILEGGSCFLYLVYMQKVVLGPNAKIFLAER